MTHWLGGLGIVVIFIALLPEAGQSTMSMYNAEVAGPTRERVLPRLHDMTNVLFRMYSGFYPHRPGYFPPVRHGFYQCPEPRLVDYFGRRVFNL